MKRDYKSMPGPRRERRPRMQTRHWVTLGLSLSLLGLAVVVVPFSAKATRSETTETQGAAPRAHSDMAHITRTLTLPNSPAPEPAVPETTEQSQPEGTWHAHRVRRGDTLSEIFSGFGLTPRDVHDVMAVGRETKPLARLHPGERVRVCVNEHNELLELVHEISKTQALHLTRENGGFVVTPVHRELEHQIAYASGTIENSLFLAGQTAGLSDAMIMEMAAIFGWDIDFVLDIRRGDRFIVVYEELFLDGEKVKDGAILAAEFINAGRTVRAVRYVDPKGRADYYTPEGKNMRKEFLRTPVKFSRISSRFSLGRRHPVLNRIRAHRGVDYAAPRGTAVRATGDGKVVFRGRKGGYGKAVIIRHGSKYTTLYAHLSGYRRGAHPGARVRQGQVIGYVGSTGLATGPHLHYEFRVHGVHRNPLTVRLPRAESVHASYKPDFRVKTRSLLAQLDHLRRTVVALNP